MIYVAIGGKAQEFGGTWDNRFSCKERENMNMNIQNEAACRYIKDSGSN